MLKTVTAKIRTVHRYQRLIIYNVIRDVVYLYIAGWSVVEAGWVWRTVPQFTLPLEGGWRVNWIYLYKQGARYVIKSCAPFSHCEKTPLEEPFPGRCREEKTLRMGAFASRRNAGVEEVDLPTSNAYRYPPKSGKKKPPARYESYLVFVGQHIPSSCLPSFDILVREWSCLSYKRLDFICISYVNLKFLC